MVSEVLSLTAWCIWLYVYDANGQSSPPLCVTFLQSDVQQKSPHTDTGTSFDILCPLLSHTLPHPLAFVPLITAPLGVFCSSGTLERGMLILSQNSSACGIQALSHVSGCSGWDLMVKWIT